LIGITSRHAGPPLEYCVALDAAAAYLSGAGPVRLSCGEAALEIGARQRVEGWESQEPTVGLWVEPRREDWGEEMVRYALALPTGARLAVVASRPLARLLPERRGWRDDALGLAYGGAGHMARGLRGSGFRLEARYGVHTLASILLNALGRLAERRARPDLADRLSAAARLAYTTDGPLAGFSTVAILFTRKKS
jgi:hypothetical protein